ncbi:MAG: hypothetical protein ACXVHV_11705 [Methanobacterium sp.]
MFQKDYKKIIEEKNKQKKMEKQLNKTRVNIIKTIKDRKRVEMEFLAAIKRQMGYWKNQMDNTDPENDKERYQQLKDNIEREKVHIEQIEDELDRINEEIKLMQKR